LTKSCSEVSETKLYNEMKRHLQGRSPRGITSF
jgi:hypothetical protein